MPAADAVESAPLREQLATVTTEAYRPELADVDRLPTLDIARSMKAEDATVTTAVAARMPEIAAAVDGVTERMTRGVRLVHAGAGTAGRLGILDASECPPTFGTGPAQAVGLIAGGPTAVFSAEDREDAARADLGALGLTADDVVVGVSASGRTPYAVAAVRHARALGALTVGLSCADNDGEVENPTLTLLASVDAPTAARLPQDAHGHLRKALEAAAA
ncbi:N-acetylmuramic acid 6-phosphate etherase [Streptomyces albogriseolus]|uniref:N-acetylmuramic acid 6-phosphate etherase n=1 Tax=Streptomyces albogriseolus TaxID=1887 RepID=UPI0033AB29BE